MTPTPRNLVCYRDGSQAKVGDHVRGRGRMAKNGRGRSKIVVGFVTEVFPGGDLTVAYLDAAPCGRIESVLLCYNGISLGVALEYGDAAAFERVAG